MTDLARFQGVPIGSEGEACLGALDPSEFSTDRRHTMKTKKPMKVCKDCGVEQPVEDFPKYGGGRPTCRCFPCQRLYKRRFREGDRNLPQREGEVPSGPFVGWLTEYVARHGSTYESASRLQIDERFLYRWVRRPSPFIMETTVDKMFCAAGEPYLLRELYPALYGEMAA